VAAPLARVPAAAAAPPEVVALRTLLPREDAAAEAYALAANRTGDPLLARLGEQCCRHAAAMRTQIEALARGVGPPRPGTAERDPDAAPLAAARSAREARAAAVALEAALVAAAAREAGGIAPAAILQTVASVAAAHEQQRVALRLALGRDPLGAPRRRSS
jgi:hypothetical protein